MRGIEQVRKQSVEAQERGEKRRYSNEEIRDILEASDPSVRVEVRKPPEALPLRPDAALSPREREYMELFAEKCRAQLGSVRVRDVKTYEERDAWRARLLAEQGPDLYEAYKNADSMRLNFNLGLHSAIRALQRVLGDRTDDLAQQLRVLALRVPESELERYNALPDEEKLRVGDAMDDIARAYLETLCDACAQARVA